MISDVRSRRPTLDEWFDALAAWAEDTIGEPQWTRLEIELAAFSAHEETYKAATAARTRASRGLGEGSRTARRGLPIDPEALSTIILALGLGTGGSGVEPTFPGRVG